MNKNTETKLLFLLLMVVTAGVFYEFYSLKQKGYLKTGYDKVKNGIEAKHNENKN
ncbi:MAG: hypothetical protein ABIF17_02550 [Patescibacteria group bacterium]